VVTYGMVHAGNRNTLHAVYDIVECSAGRTDRVLAHDVRYADATHIVEALNMLALAHITAE
jgi:hypothetical protein